MAQSSLIEAHPGIMIVPTQGVRPVKKRARSNASVLALKIIKSNLARRHSEGLGQIGYVLQPARKGPN